MSLDLTGQTFGRLMVLGRASTSKSTGVRWLCRCACGVEKAIQIRRTPGRATQSCGCLQRETQRQAVTRYPGIPPAFNDMISRYRTQAQRRGIEFALDNTLCYSLMSQICHYCGIPPSTSHSIRNATILCNGLDRCDSQLGYVEGNVVSCCKICNIAKSTMSEKEFLAWVNRVFAFQNRV